MVDHRTQLGLNNRAEVLNWLIAQPEPLILSEIAAGLDMSYPTIHRHITDLETEGQVKRISLRRARNGTRSAFKAVPSTELSISDKGKLRPVHATLVDNYGVNSVTYRSTMKYLKQLPDEDTDKKYLIAALKQSPAYLVSLAIASIYVTNADRAVAIYPRITKETIKQAIEAHEKELITLNSILNCGPLWDRKQLPELLKPLRKVSLDAMQDLLNGVDPI